VTQERKEGAGLAKLNIPMRVDTAPGGVDIARENWSKHEQKAAPHALGGIQGQGGTGRRSRRQDAGRTHPTQITDWKNQLLAKAADMFGGEPRADEPTVDLKVLHAKIGQLAFGE
jgi:hypothetical protein